MQRFYMVSNPERPWVILFMSQDLSAVAEAVAAQTGTELEVYANDDGCGRPLDPVELAQLTDLVQRARAEASGRAAKAVGPQGGQRPHRQRSV